MSLNDKVTSMIKSLGGRNQTAYLICSESPEWFTRTETDMFKKRAGWAKAARDEKHPSRWNEEDTAYLIKNYGRIRSDVIAKRLGRSKASIISRFKHSANQAQKEWVLKNGRDAWRGKNLKKN